MITDMATNVELWIFIFKASVVVFVLWVIKEIMEWISRRSGP
jgi:hypothetical protein